MSPYHCPVEVEDQKDPNGMHWSRMYISHKTSYFNFLCVCVCVFLCSDEQYRQLWSEIENMSWLYATLSDKHRALYDYVTHVVGSSPSMQYAHKAPHLDTPGKQKKHTHFSGCGRDSRRGNSSNILFIAVFFSLLFLCLH